MSNQYINPAIPTIKGNANIRIKPAANLSMQGVSPTMQANIPSLDGVNPTMQAGIPSLDGINPTMQGDNFVTEYANNNYIANRVRASQTEEDDSAKKLGLTVLTGFGLGQIMDVFNAKCAGEYDKSLLGKIGNFGDKVAETKVGGFFEKIFTAPGKWLRGQAAKPNHQVAYTLVNHSTQPEWSMVKTPANGVTGFLAADTNSVFEQFLEPITGAEKRRLFGILPPKKAKLHFQKLEQYGASQTEINNLINSLKGKPIEQQAIALQREELRLLGATTEDIAKYEKRGIRSMQNFAKNLKAKKLGFRHIGHYNKMKSVLAEDPKKYYDILQNADKNIKVSIWRDAPKNFFTKIKNRLFGRTVAVTELQNKFAATLGKGNKTALGRTLPKITAWLAEGCTSRFGGGKIMPFMQAMFIADIILATIRSKKGDKGKTFAERIVNDFMYFVGLTAGILGMHKLGGFKYAGTDAAGREAYRKELEAFKQEVKTTLKVDKAGFKARKKAINDMLGYKNIKNPITKLLNKAARFMNMGNEAMPHYVSANKVNLNWLRKIFNKNIIGVPVRFAIPMMVITPFLAKTAVKLVHKIFGRPEVSVLDEEKEEEQATDQTAPNGLNQPSQDTFIPSIDKGEDTNLIRRATKTYTDPVTGEVKTVTEETTTNKPDDNKELEPKRTYIPDPHGMVPSGVDTSNLDKAISRSEIAEKQIQSILASLNK